MSYDGLSVGTANALPRTEQGALARRPGSPTLLRPLPSRMFAFEVALAAAPLVIAVYAYFGYPAVLWLIAAVKRKSGQQSGAGWPSVTITVPVYNAAGNIRGTLERLLEVDYPREKMQVLVLSDASNDGTDEIVKEYSSRGVELLRLPVRKGKTTAENAAVAVARGELIVNVDGTVLVPRESLKPLVRVFDDPTIGVDGAGGRFIELTNPHDLPLVHCHIRMERRPT